MLNIESWHCWLLLAVCTLACQCFGTAGAGGGFDGIKGSREVSRQIAAHGQASRAAPESCKINQTALREEVLSRAFGLHLVLATRFWGLICSQMEISIRGSRL